MGRSDRPAAYDVMYFLLDHDVLEPGRIRLSAWARQHRLGEARCPQRHLLAEPIRTPYGLLVMWRFTRSGGGWSADWLDEIADPAAIEVWCLPCRAKTWTVDLSDCAHPRVMPYHHGTTTEPRRAASNPGR
jgi:hypothetical protein